MQGFARDWGERAEIEREVKGVVERGFHDRDQGFEKELPKKTMWILGFVRARWT